jgi:hypothetical protein
MKYKICPKKSNPTSVSNSCVAGTIFFKSKPIYIYCISGRQRGQQIIYINFWTLYIFCNLKKYFLSKLAQKRKNNIVWNIEDLFKVSNMLYKINAKYAKLYSWIINSYCLKHADSCCEDIVYKIGAGYKPLLKSAVSQRQCCMSQPY